MFGMKTRKQTKKEIETAQGTTKAYHKRGMNRNLSRQWYYQPLNRFQERHAKHKHLFNYRLNMPEKRILGLIIGLTIIAMIGIVFYANLFLHFHIRLYS
jgi:hypothetical protein